MKTYIENIEKFGESLNQLFTNSDSREVIPWGVGFAFVALTLLGCFNLFLAICFDRGAFDKETYVGVGLFFLFYYITFGSIFLVLSIPKYVLKYVFKLEIK